MTELRAKAKLKKIRKFYEDFTCSVEVSKGEAIQKFLFVKPFICHFTTKGIKKSLIFDLERNSYHEKLADLHKKCEFSEKVLRLRQALFGHRALYFCVVHIRVISIMSYFFIFLINVMIFFSFQYKTDSEFHILIFESDAAYTELQNRRVIWILFMICTGFNIIFALLLCTFGFLLNTPKIFVGSVPKTILRSFTLFENAYNLVLLTLSLLSIKYPIMYGVLLLDIFKRSKDLQNIIKSVTHNWNQFLKTNMILLIVMYIFALIAFFFFPSDYQSVRV